MLVLDGRRLLQAVLVVGSNLAGGGVSEEVLRAQAGDFGRRQADQDEVPVCRYYDHKNCHIDFLVDQLEQDVIG
ncbi:MAG: hypothetical protein A2087_11305 [Spirochaetes bacterium GWD1_61_31]|nr:MAG: hypothetical protein A2Y37_01305 [Spirochaetes bacterium GWB1_60_80]OHD33556.1 MAG: hypothetical protein A2004_06605 [Spirochaetes bacterium GWC1_61_12]OHD35704.1 MAG: hypothetical protein A2087_11305 [Spirochaetes bacterium GWD1_61_31]OHD41841.1 MAG: hypothetical protein A2Y35_04400 [Spirochaetes bacterium GWE1_60_18]OHD57821.1 MAG: hypothetical protein A2Y32_14095 [Spirochaetes bacterium GWF1_60_12]HAW85193.1 hypothetical protein [Spirochaetaceae bacterium]